MADESPAQPTPNDTPDGTPSVAQLQAALAAARDENAKLKAANRKVENNNKTNMETIAGLQKRAAGSCRRRNPNRCRASSRGLRARHA